jgi:general secretion pathway protein G
MRTLQTFRCFGMKSLTGFTLVELLVVLAIVALLLTLAAPQYLGSVSKANEAVLRTDLRLLREAIDKSYADKGELPSSLQSLVERRYIRGVPSDPITESSETWVLIPHPDGSSAGIYDVRSGAPGHARDGTSFASW